MIEMNYNLGSGLEKQPGYRRALTAAREMYGEEAAEPAAFTPREVFLL